MYKKEGKKLTMWFSVLIIFRVHCLPSSRCFRIQWTMIENCCCCCKGGTEWSSTKVDDDEKPGKLVRICFPLWSSSSTLLHPKPRQCHQGCGTTSIVRQGSQSQQQLQRQQQQQQQHQRIRIHNDNNCFSWGYFSFQHFERCWCNTIYNHWEHREMALRQSGCARLGTGKITKPLRLSPTGNQHNFNHAQVHLQQILPSRWVNDKLINSYYFYPF